jgi:hypothetical protein
MRKGAGARAIGAAVSLALLSGARCDDPCAPKTALVISYRRQAAPFALRRSETRRRGVTRQKFPAKFPPQQGGRREQSAFLETHGRVGRSAALATDAGD